MNRLTAIIIVIFVVFLPFMVTITLADESVVSPHPGLPLFFENQKTVSTGKDQNQPISIQATRLENMLLENERLLNRFRIESQSNSRGNRPNDETHLPVLTLEDLKKKFRTPPDLRVALAELEESHSIVEQKRALSGMRIFGGAGLGTYREPVTDTVVRDFQRANVKLGLRYPLLGSLNQERIDIIKSEVHIWEKEHEVQLIEQNGLNALRTYYINYWGNQKKIDISRVFLKNEEEVKKIFKHRTNAGYLLDSDRQEFMSAFALVRRNVVDFKSRRDSALNVLRLFVDPGCEKFKPFAPRLSMPCAEKEKLKAIVLNTNPELKLLKEQLKNHHQLGKEYRLTEIKGDVSLAGTASTDFPENQSGYGVAINLNIQFPVHIKRAEATRRRVFQATLKKIEQQLVLKKTRLLQVSEEALERYFFALENVTFAGQRLKAGKERVREKLLRSAYLEGDTIEKLQQSRYHYYQAAIDYIEAQTNRLLSQARLLEFASGDCATQKEVQGVDTN